MKQLTNRTNVEDPTNAATHYATFITCFLKGAIPSSIIRDIRKDYHFALERAKMNTTKDNLRAKEFYLRKHFIRQIDNLLDARRIGPHFLKRSDIYAMLKNQILDTGSESWQLNSYKILSNHIHLLISFPIQEFKKSSVKNIESKGMEEILAEIKLKSAAEINKKLRRIGPVWEEENFCLQVTCGEMFQNIRRYIKNNKCFLDLKDIQEEQTLLLSKTIESFGKKTLIYSEFRPGIVS